MQLDIWNWMSQLDENNDTTEIELQKWMEENREAVSNGSGTEAKQNVVHDIYQNMPNTENTEELLSRISNNDIRAIILKAIDSGFKVEELKAMLNGGKTAEEMERIFQMLFESKKT